MNVGIVKSGNGGTAPFPYLVGNSDHAQHSRFGRKQCRCLALSYKASYLRGKFIVKISRIILTGPSKQDLSYICFVSGIDRALSSCHDKPCPYSFSGSRRKVRRLHYRNKSSLRESADGFCYRMFTL